ncbi:non-homologous end joining protein Ku [Ferrigenium kumadai]|uniref:Non-homologous end joining protein Ku n=1 Tax=Ferrigenium kumadai TaxID=1682490 RepID=A0AAN1SY97_9PROT|nr:Ku protein [Ferrigenium kumadai]BBI98932.1 non-homologous end joining protein Ku [Ferrigenium kumadai]
MSIRAMWKGVIRFDSVRVPVKLYGAVEDRNVHFRLLHRQDMEPVHQHLVNAETDEVVPYEEIRRAYITEAGDRVLLDKAELEALEPQPSRDIEIVSFVPLQAIDHRWYDRPYYLGPDENDAAFSALADALEEMQVEGIARWVMRNKSYMGALQLYQGCPMLMSLHHAEEVVPVEALKPPEGPPLDKRELGLAHQLIEMLESEFQPQEYHDEFRDHVLEMLAAKAQGKQVKKHVPKPREPSIDLSQALESSIRQVRKQA